MSQPGMADALQDRRAKMALCRVHMGKAELGKAPVALSPAEQARHGG